MPGRFYVVTQRIEGVRMHTLVVAILHKDKPNDASKDEKSDTVIMSGTLKEFWAQLKAAGYVWARDGSFGRKYWTKDK